MGGMEDDFFLYPNMVNTLSFNADDGTLENTFFFRKRSLRIQFNTFITQIHYGQYGGLTPLLLSITGFLLWLSKQASLRRKGISQRRAVPTLVS